MKKILITGAGGFVGSRVLQQCQVSVICCAVVFVLELFL